MKWMLIIALLLGARSTPDFDVWVECVLRGPYTGMAVAYLSYRYDGEFAITTEDSRYFGDTETGETMVFALPVHPGEHTRFMQVNVGANKVVLWKIVLFGDLHVVTIWDNPDVPDCPWLLPTPDPPAEMEL